MRCTRHPDPELHAPDFFEHDNGQLTAMTFEIVKAEYDAQGRRSLVPTASPAVRVPCDVVLIAGARKMRFRGSRTTWALPLTDGFAAAHTRHLPVHPAPVFFGGDAAYGPKTSLPPWRRGTRPPSPSTAFCTAKTCASARRRAPTWCPPRWASTNGSYDNDVSNDLRFKGALGPGRGGAGQHPRRVELGSTPPRPSGRRWRCRLNCDVQTVSTPACIECDACVDICPMDSITFTTNGEEADLRPANARPGNLAQTLMVFGATKTGRILVKDEDVCLHCGLCAERCPTGAWDMQKFRLDTTQASPGLPRCPDHPPHAGGRRYEAH